MGMEKFVMGASAWVWDEFGEQFKEQVKPGFWAFLKRKQEDVKHGSDKVHHAGSKWQDFNWGKAAERYKQHLQKVYGHVRVIGTTEPIPIGDIFTDVYILEKPLAYRRFDMTKWQEFQKESENLENVERITRAKSSS